MRSTVQHPSRIAGDFAGMTTLQILGVLALFASVAVLVYTRTRKPDHVPADSATAMPSSDQPSGVDAARLRHLALERGEYRIFVGVPPSAPTHWQVAESVRPDGLVLPDGASVVWGNVRAAVVAYPNGQILGHWLGNLEMPEGLTGLWRDGPAETDQIRLEDLRDGEPFARVRFGLCLSRPGERDAYSTSLVNLAEVRIRVEKFGGYQRHGVEFHLSNVSGRFYTSEEFRTWYGLEDEEWILPGQEVADPNNYGPRPTLWAYYCTTEQGTRFLVGAMIE